MNKLVKLKAKETAATNSDFYNLFRPIAPSIDVIGKVAQVISGLTEAITIWYITQSEMAETSKFVSILVSIIAMILVVALLEIGGRKFLQVLTRALVWKRLKNAWYIGLFAIVLLITIGMGAMSFRLSTNGIKHAFVSTVDLERSVDESGLRATFRESVKEINLQLEHDLAILNESHNEVLSSTNNDFESRIQAVDQKIRKYEEKQTQGFKWAKSQSDKYRKELAQLEMNKANTILKLHKAHSKKLDQWQNKKEKALNSERTDLQLAIQKKENILKQAQQSKMKNATFWGGLFSFIVGFSVILAFVCIISIEVYRRGSGIQVEYQEEEKDPSVISVFWRGLSERFEMFFRRKAERFANIPSKGIAPKSIGFDFSNTLPTNSFDEADR